jgi:hypothetical protein
MRLGNPSRLRHMRQAFSPAGGDREPLRRRSYPGVARVKKPGLRETEARKLERMPEGAGELLALLRAPAAFGVRSNTGWRAGLRETRLSVIISIR